MVYTAKVPFKNSLKAPFQLYGFLQNNSLKQKGAAP